jgi:hypothetical protein
LTTKTAEDGSYVVRNIESGSYRLTVSAEGLRAAQNYTWVDAGHSVALDFTLVPDYEEGVGTVKGTVIAGEGSEKAGQPLAGAQVEARPPASLQGPNFSTLTDSQGHFSLNVPAGFEEITAWADGYESLVKPVKVSANDVVELNFVPAVQKDYEGD